MTRPSIPGGLCISAGSAADGQFDLVWSSEKPIRPIPYPSSRPQAEWDAFLENLNQTWGGWANPIPRGSSSPKLSSQEPDHPADTNPQTENARRHSTDRFSRSCTSRKEASNSTILAEFPCTREGRFVTAAFHSQLPYRYERP